MEEGPWQIAPVTDGSFDRLLAMNEERLSRLARASAHEDEDSLLAESLELATSIIEALPSGVGKFGLAASRVARRLSADGRFRAALEAAEAQDRSENALRYAMGIAHEVVRSATGDLRGSLDDVKDITVHVGDQVTEQGAILRRVDETTRRTLERLADGAGSTQPERVRAALEPPWLDLATVERVASLAARQNRRLLLEIAGYDPYAVPEMETRLEAARHDLERLNREDTPSALLEYLTGLAGFVPSPSDRRKVEDVLASLEGQR